MPSKEAQVESISLSDCIPFVDDQIDQMRRDHMLKKEFAKAKVQLGIYYRELQTLLIKAENTLESVRQGEGSAGASQGLLTNLSASST